MREREMRTNEFRVVGPPGCGKTTWLGERVDDVVERGRRPLVTSLTKAAAAEIGARKLPISFDCLGTLHSHCYHALGQPEIAQEGPRGSHVVPRQRYEELSHHDGRSPSGNAPHPQADGQHLPPL